MSDSTITFRELRMPEDAPMLTRWMADPDVQPWYGMGEVTEERVADEFCDDGMTRRFIMQFDGVDIGYVQTYLLGDEPDYARQIGLDEDAVSLDILIGESAYRNRGLGAPLLRAVVDELVFGRHEVNLAMINPDPQNLRARKTYEKAGFRALKTVTIDADEPWNAGDELVMIRHRNDPVE